MNRLALVLVASTVLLAPHRGRASSPTRGLIQPDAGLVKSYCVSCHNDRRQVGGVSLEAKDPMRAAENPELWERVVRKLRAGAMPPRGMPRPDHAALDTFAGALEAQIDAAAVLQPGRVGPHRLNRAEYVNAVRDLIGIPIDGKALLPDDDASYGFDNIGDVLTVSTGLLERYLIVAKEVSRVAVGDTRLRPVKKTYAYPYLAVTQRDRLSEDLPFGSRGGMLVRHYFPLDGVYELRLRLERQQLAFGDFIRGWDDPNQLHLYVDRAPVTTFPIGGGLTEIQKKGIANQDDQVEDHADDGLVVRLPITAGTHAIGAAFQRSVWYTEGYGASTLPWLGDAFSRGVVTGPDYGKIESTLGSIEITGPFDATGATHAPVQSRVFVCHPGAGDSESLCAQNILSRLAHRAYRRSLSEEDVHAVMHVYDQGRAGADFETGIRRGIERILTAPDFLFRLEGATVRPRAVARISDIDLASRLSFFLWSSIPDDELLSLAEKGRLSDPRTLEQQVHRMLVDKRSSAFRENFFGQWLYLRNIATLRPDIVAFPDFNDDLREAFRLETELFLQTQLEEDRSAMELLTANYTFLNETLARHYDIPGVYGSHFRRVTYPDGRRAGILGQASILAVTSYPNRTSPVVRGKWLLENIFGTPPPPPPPSVPPFPEQEGKATEAPSVRERLEQHRRNPVCSACHSAIDPFGFAFENFDAMGKWRSTDGKSAVDASGAFADGTKFDGPASFRAGLIERRSAYLTTLTQKLLTYAIGRGVGYEDMPAVRRILRESLSTEYRWSSLIMAVVRSPSFQMRRADS
jgi:hypothetical protein